ncbi:MAG: hypothetical protein IJQ23_06150, partial [Clostridia bacterium]|nr:hypothetical protein [Clostridia bacterium]
MKKRTLYSLVITLTLFAVMFITCGVMGLKGEKKAYAVAPKPEPTEFAMHLGASIKNSDPSGIRFTTYVNPDYYDGLVKSEKTFHFGTIYAPATAYSGTIEDFNHSSTVTGGVSDIVINGEEYWGTDTVNEVDYKIYNAVQLYSENARDNGYYGVKMLAKSYVWIDENGDNEEDAEEFTYVDGVVRSIAQAAAIALAEGYDNRYIDAIPQYALDAKNVDGTEDKAVTLNGFIYHKSGNNSHETGRANQDYIYLPSGGTADFSYTPALLHEGDYMTAASDYPITYLSSDDSVFTVDGGTITAVGAGTASLTAGVGPDVVAPVTTVSVVSPASSTYNRSGLAVTYLFEGVSYYADSHILTLDADYINDKIAEGYNSVQVTMNIPSNGGSGISVRLYIDDTENKIASGYKDSLSVSGTYDLVSDKAYSVLFRQSVDITLDMTVVLQFNKDVTAFSSSNGVYTNYGTENTTLTASATTVNANSETTTYTVTIANNTYTFLNFNAPFINEKIAAGYTKVAFYIGPQAGYKATRLEGTNLTQISKDVGDDGGYISYDPVALTADSEYRLRFNLAATLDITVTVTFIKDADIISYCLANGAEFGVSSSTTENTEGELITYTFANVTNSVDVYYDFNASYINEKVAEGYETVTFAFTNSGYKAVKLYKNGILTQSPAAAYPAITLTAEEISANDYFRIVLTHNINSNQPANITITAKFIKPVKVNTSGNGTIGIYGEELTFSTSEPVTDLNSQVITYTFNLTDHVYAFINFNAPL